MVMEKNTPIDPRTMEKRKLKAQVWDLMLRGKFNQGEIGIVIGRSQQVVSGYMRELKEDLRERDREVALDKLRLAEEQLSWNIWEATNAWERSKQNKETITFKSCEKCDGTGMREEKWCPTCNGEGTAQVTRIEGQAGDVSFLAQRSKDIVHMAKLRGDYQGRRSNETQISQHIHVKLTKEQEAKLSIDDVVTLWELLKKMEKEPSGNGQQVLDVKSKEVEDD
jgi:hypothetical protein